MLSYNGYDSRWRNRILRAYHRGEAGPDFTLAAYDHAVREGYRFFSYGDCMLVL